MATDRVRDGLLGTPPKRVLFGIGPAIGLTVASATVFCALFRLSIALGFVGPEVLLSIPGQIVGWSPDWWRHLWVATLVILVVLSLALAIRDASLDGGFVGSVALVSSVPIGTVLYQLVLANYLQYLYVDLLSGSPEYPHPFGYFYDTQAVFGPWARLYAIDLVVLLGLATAVFLLGRRVSGDERKDRWTVITVSALFLGPSFVGYFQPSWAAQEFHHLLLHRDSHTFLLYNVGVGIGLAALGWVAINGLHIARKRDRLSRSRG